MRIGNYESSSEGGHVGTAITFLLIGLGAGALAALMFAPKSGKQFRRDLQRGYGDARERIGDWAEDARESVRDAAKRGADFAADMADDLRDAAREKVEPLRKAINRS